MGQRGWWWWKMSKYPASWHKWWPHGAMGGDSPDSKGDWSEQEANVGRDESEGATTAPHPSQGGRAPLNIARSFHGSLFSTLRVSETFFPSPRSQSHSLFNNDFGDQFCFYWAQHILYSVTVLSTVFTSSSLSFLQRVFFFFYFPSLTCPPGLILAMGGQWQWQRWSCPTALSYQVRDTHSDPWCNYLAPFLKFPLLHLSSTWLLSQKMTVAISLRIPVSNSCEFQSAEVKIEKTWNRGKWGCLDAGIVYYALSLN